MGKDVFNQGKLTWRGICRAGTSAGWSLSWDPGTERHRFQLAMRLLQLAGFGDVYELECV